MLRFMTKTAFIVFAIVSIAQLCTAEGTNGMYFIFGGDMPEINDLNTMLKSNGYSELANQLISYGFGFHVTAKGGFMVGMEMHWLYGKEVTSNGGNLKSNLSSSYWFVNLGYSILSIGGANIYPYAGLGSGSTILTISNAEVPSFEEILDNPTGVTKLSTGGFLVNGGLCVEYSVNNLILGLRGGYIYDPYIGDWEIEEAEVSGGPDTGINGPYVRLMLGFGG